MLKPIALIGLPGSGKSTVGLQLSRCLKLSFLDSDHTVEEMLHCSIREYFESEGEDRFRDVEQLVIEELTKRTDCVISTGGGAVLRQTNRKYLLERCKTIYLHSEPTNVFKRIRHDRTRPLLQGDDPLKRLEELYATRDPLYREVACMVVETGKLATASVTNHIIEQLALLNIGPA